MENERSWLGSNWLPNPAYDIVTKEVVEKTLQKLASAFVSVVKELKSCFTSVVTLRVPSQWLKYRFR